MSTVVEVVEGLPKRKILISLYVGNVPITTEITDSLEERALLMQYLRGPAGSGGGSGGVTYNFAASLTWTINHNLGYRPAVDLYDSGSMQIEAQVVHTSLNQTIVTFNTATAGFARLN